LKGAEEVIRDTLLREQEKIFITEEVENLAREGLRTLVMA